MNGEYMKQWGIIWGAFLVLLLTVTGTPNAQDVISVPHKGPNSLQTTPSGANQNKAWINWTRQTLRAVGRGEAPGFGENHHAPFHAMAKARQKAYRRLLGAAKSLQLTPTGSVADFLGTDDRLLAEFENLLKHAEVVQTEFLSTGPVEITLEFSLTGDFARMVLPDTITRLEKIEYDQSETTTDASEYTGLVLDARGLAVTPAMCFKVLDEDGMEVYGPAYASRENVVAFGMCDYVSGMSDIEDSERVGGNPLVVKGIKVHPPGASNIVISGTAAARLRGSVEHLAFLKKCRVIVVMAPNCAEK